MKSKKILLGSLSTMALVATPIAAVVSCGDDASATKDTKIVKSAATGFVVEGVYIPADLASKAGEVTAQGSKLTWTEALKADAVVKFTAKGATKAEDKKAKKADADHLVLPLKGLNGVGMYGDAAALKLLIEGLLNSGDINLTLKAKDSKSGDIEKTELDKLNAFVKEAKLEAEKVNATVAGDKTTFAITWKDAATTGGAGTGKGQAGSTATADNAAIKIVKDKLEAMAFGAATSAGIKAGTLGAITDLAGLKAMVLNTAGAAATLTGTVTFPTSTELTGVTLTVKSVATRTTAGAANIVVSVAKGQGTTVDATIVITLA